MDEKMVMAVLAVTAKVEAGEVSRVEALAEACKEWGVEEKVTAMGKEAEKK